ncbi:MAG: AAA family ATPase, partial [Sedimentisphaerales bacterium]|nr:AAA family ATPase [Sedimentisphaerales bacterium]
PATGGLADMVGASKAGGGNYFKTQCELLQSQRVLAQASQRLSGGYKGWSSRDDVIDLMRERVKIQPVPGSHLIDIIGMSDSGAEAADVANQVMATFVETSTARRQMNNARIVERIKAQIAEFDKEEQALTNDINKFRQEHRISGAEDAPAVVQARIAQLNQQISQVHMDRLELASKQEQLKNILQGSGDRRGGEEYIPQINSDRTVVSLQQKLNQLQQEEVRLIQVYLSGHEKIRDIRVQVADTQTRLIASKQWMLESLYEETREQYTTMVSREQSLNKLLEQQKQYATQLSLWYQEYKSKLADLETTYLFKKKCTARLRQFSLEQEMLDSPIVVVDEARVPTNPSGLSAPRRASSILLLGLLFSVMFILTLDRFSIAPRAAVGESMAFPPASGMGPLGNWPVLYWPSATPPEVTQHSSAEVKEKSAVRETASVLGRIGRIELGGSNEKDVAFAARCRVVHTDQRSGSAAAFREISANLLGRFGDTQQSVAVTSLSAQSGKTTFACNLALMLAQSSRKVVLVDMNPQGAALGRVFATEQGQSDISDVLADPNVLDEALRETDVANLKVLHCRREVSTPDGDSGWLYRTNKASLAELDRKLAQQFDWVIYDAESPRSQLTANLLHAVGKAIYIDATADPHSQEEVIEQIEHCGALNIGLVENTPIPASTVQQR